MVFIRSNWSFSSFTFLLNSLMAVADHNRGINVILIVSIKCGCVLLVELELRLLDCLCSASIASNRPDPIYILYLE
jgi:hypothetical protein